MKGNREGHALGVRDEYGNSNMVGGVPIQQDCPERQGKHAQDFGRYPKKRCMGVKEKKSLFPELELRKEKYLAVETCKQVHFKRSPWGA